MKKTLVILTSNEIEGIKALFGRIPLGEFDESFAIDWNSKDGTVEFFKEKSIRVISQTKRGRGEAFRMAVDGSQGDILVFFSPDGNENPQDAPKLARLIEEGFDMAIASRFAKGAKAEKEGLLIPYRAWANQAMTILADLFFGGNLTDSINGFRAVRKESFKKLKVDAQGFAIEYQMSIRAMKLKQKIKEIPTVEGQRIGSRSKAGSLSVGWKLFKLLLREIFLGSKF